MMTKKYLINQIKILADQYRNISNDHDDIQRDIVQTIDENYRILELEFGLSDNDIRLINSYF